MTMASVWLMNKNQKLFLVECNDTDSSRILSCLDFSTYSWNILVSFVLASHLEINSLAEGGSSRTSRACCNLSLLYLPPFSSVAQRLKPACPQCREIWFDPRAWEDPREGEIQTHSVTCAWELTGRALVGTTGHKSTEDHFHSLYPA